MATHGNRFAAHGKEGVDGSSPSEGFAVFSLLCGPSLKQRQVARIGKARDRKRDGAAPSADAAGEDY
jgi:hypothetical protein